MNNRELGENDMSETPLYYKTISQIAELLSSKKLSPVELTKVMLDRIEHHDGHLKSYATVTAEQAMAAAQQAEQEITAGNYRGPLHGVPIGVKDLLFTNGIRTMGGAYVMAAHIPKHDSTVVKKLKDSGAVILGKLNLTEGAMGGYHPEFDIPINPWNPDRWTGSSSSGSGVATAAGLCSGSIGSDTGGSIRFPSAACGIVGLKPTFGRVSRYGVLELALSMDHIGPMTRSVADAAIMLEVIAGSDTGDFSTLDEAIMLEVIAGSDIDDYLTLDDTVPTMYDEIHRGIQGVRIGFDENYATKDVDAELAEAVSNGVKLLQELGAEIIDVEVSDIDEYVLAWPTICSWEAVKAHVKCYPSHREHYGPWFQGWLDMGANVTPAEYEKAHKLRTACTKHFKRVFQDIDVLVCPSMSAPPHPITPEMLYGPMETRPAKFQRFTVPFNYNGTPTLSVPCGMNSEGLPLSIQFIGKDLSEPLLLQVGHAYESATTWHTLHPDV